MLLTWLLQSSWVVAQSHAVPVMLHTPFTLGQLPPAPWHAPWVFEQVKIFEQQNSVCPWLQAVEKQAGGGLSLLPLHVPKVAWQPQLWSTALLSQLMFVQAVVHAVPLGEGAAQVPGVRQSAAL